jgi:hypothetical protein
MMAAHEQGQTTASPSALLSPRNCVLVALLGLVVGMASTVVLVLLV